MRPSLKNIPLITSVNGRAGRLWAGLVDGCHKDCCRLVDRRATYQRIRKVRIETFVGCTLRLNLWVNNDFFQVRTIACDSLRISARSVIRRLWTEVWTTMPKCRQFSASVDSRVTYGWVGVLCPFPSVAWSTQVVFPGGCRNSWRKWTTVMVLALRRWKHIVKNAYSLRVVGRFVGYRRRRRYNGNICVTIQRRSRVTIVTRRYRLLCSGWTEIIRCQALHGSSGNKLYKLCWKHKKAITNYSNITKHQSPVISKT